MAQAHIKAGICGYETDVEAEAGEVYRVTLRIRSDCPAIQKLAAELTEVDAVNEISHRGQTPEVLRQGALHCTHAACPVPVGILKAVEVAAGLALPAPVVIAIDS